MKVGVIRILNMRKKPPIALAMFLLACPLLCKGAVESVDDKIGAHSISPSGKLRFELRGGNILNQLWMGPVGHPKAMKVLFEDENGLSVTLPQVSTDERLLVTTHGGASAGRVPELFLHAKDGNYLHAKVDVANLAWKATAKQRHYAETAFLAHQYCEILSVKCKPLSVVFRMDGNYKPSDGESQKDFDTVYLRYSVETKKLEVIARPKGVED